MRPKTKSRLIVVICVAVLLGGLGTGFWFWRRAQLDAKLQGYRDAGMAAFKQGDYIATLDQLKLYVGKRLDDADALYAYAKSRSAVTDPNGKHISEGVAAYRRYLTMRPDDDVARHEVLGLYERAQILNTELAATADELLAKDPKDAAALRAKAVALGRFRRYSEALDPAMKYNELNPLDLEGQVETLKILNAMDRLPKEMIDRAEKLRKQFPGDPRFDVLLAVAYMGEFDRERKPQSLDRAGKLLVDAAAQEAPDVQFVQVTTTCLDRLGFYDKAADLLKRAAKKNSDPGMMLLLVQRLWQNGQFDQVAETLQGVAADSRQSDTRLLAYKALALCSLKKLDDAKPIVDALAARQDDGAAVAWSMALRTRFYDNLAPKAAIDQYSAALVRDRKNFVILYLIGESYASLGEYELAVQNWNKIAEYAPSWSAPRVRIAQVYGNTGRNAPALQEAEAAYRQSPSGVTKVNLILAQYKSMAESDDIAGLSNLIADVASVQKVYPGETQTLPIYVALLVRRDAPADPKATPPTPSDADKAKEIINGILTSDNKLPEETYLSLAALSREKEFGLEEKITDKAEKLYGLTPRLALNRAARMYFAQGKTDEALAFLTKAAEEHGHTIAWDLIVAQFREIARDPGAKDAWIKLANANENDLSVQNAALNAGSIWTSDKNDREFIRRTIDRVRNLTGDEGMSWRMARARWLLSGDSNRDRDTAEAIVTLTDIVKGSHRSARPLMALADALERSGNFAGALEKNREAAIYSPQSAEIAIRLIERLQTAGKYEESREQLNRIAKIPLNVDQTNLVAAYLSQQGLNAEGVAMLEKQGNGSPTSDTIAAEILRRRGYISQAQKIYDKLLALPSVPPKSLISAADFYAARGDLAQAQTILARLDSAKTAPGERESMLGAFNESYVSKSKALEYYIAATKAAPADENMWVQLLGFYLRSGRYDDLISTAPEAAKAVPGSEAVETMRRTADVFKANTNRTDLAFLARIISRDPMAPAVRKTLDLIEDIRKSGMAPEQIANRTRQLADAFPQFLPLHLMVTQSLLDANRLTDATAAAARAVVNFPSSPETTQMAVNAYAAAGSNAEMLQAAQRWRDRSKERPLPADLSIAEALLRLNKPTEAAETLKPYVEVAIAHPDDNTKILTAYCYALLRAGKTDEAAQVLFPLAQKSVAWRGVWLSAGAAAQKNYAASKAWIERVTPSMTDAVNEQVALAEAWFNSGKAFNSKEAFERSRDILKPLAARSDVKPELAVLYAQAAEQAGDPAGAEAGYRAALKLNPRYTGAQNNLAYLLYNKGGDLSEAKDLATKATSGPNPLAIYFDTLGRILMKMNDRPGALAAFDAALQRDSRSIEAMIGKANLLAQDGKADKAAAMVQQIDTQFPNPVNLDPSLKAELDAVRGAIKTSASTDQKPVAR